MKGLKIIALLFGVVVIGTASFYLTFFIINGVKANKSSLVEQDQPITAEMVSPNENELTKSNSEGSVSIEATILAEKSSSNELVFEVIMNTHSVDLLQFDLSELAAISFGVETNNTGVYEWKTTNQDSHHLRGYLKWNGKLGENYKYINLELKNIDNNATRMFSWEKSEVIDQIINK